MTYTHGERLHPTDLERLIAAVMDPLPFERLRSRQEATADDVKRRRNAVRRARRLLEALDASGFEVIDIAGQEQAEAQVAAYRR